MKKTVLIFLSFIIFALLTNCSPKLKWLNDSDDDYSSSDIEVTIDSSTWTINLAKNEETDYKPVSLAKNHSYIVKFGSDDFITNFDYSFELFSKYSVHLGDEANDITDAIHKE